jgi:hypothetical protein
VDSNLSRSKVTVFNRCDPSGVASSRHPPPACDEKTAAYDEEDAYRPAQEPSAPPPAALRRSVFTLGRLQTLLHPCPMRDRMNLFCGSTSLAAAEVLRWLGKRKTRQLLHLALRSSIYLSSSTYFEFEFRYECYVGLNSGNLVVIGAKPNPATSGRAPRQPLRPSQFPVLYWCPPRRQRERNASPA